MVKKEDYSDNNKSIYILRQDLECAIGVFKNDELDLITKGQDMGNQLVAIYMSAINLMKQKNICYLLLEDGKSVSNFMLISNSYRTRARDMFCYLHQDMGILKEFMAEDHSSSWVFGYYGNSDKAFHVDEMELEAMKKYLCESEIVDASSYADLNEKMLSELPIYQKKAIPRAFVKSLDIATKGTQLIFKTLENKSGVHILADEDTYIMIGTSGEPYDISRKKFDELYYAKSNHSSLQKYCSDFTVKPSCFLGSDGGDEVDFAKYACICLPRKLSQVYVKKLERITKVFTVRKPREYYLGTPGSYMTIDKDNMASIHIIESSVLEKTYDRLNHRL